MVMTLISNFKLFVNTVQAVRQVNMFRQHRRTIQVSLLSILPEPQSWIFIVVHPTIFNLMTHMFRSVRTSLINKAAAISLPLVCSLMGPTSCLWPSPLTAMRAWVAIPKAHTTTSQKYSSLSRKVSVPADDTHVTPTLKNLLIGLCLRHTCSERSDLRLPPGTQPGIKLRNGSTHSSVSMPWSYLSLCTKAPHTLYMRVVPGQ